MFFKNLKKKKKWKKFNIICYIKIYQFKKWVIKLRMLRMLYEWELKGENKESHDSG